MVQWLRLHASTAAGMGLIPGWGIKIPYAMHSVAKKNKECPDKYTITRQLNEFHVMET